MTEEAEALARRKKIRAGHKASTTRILGQVTSALDDTPPNAHRLSLLKLTLTEKLETIKGLDAEIVEITPEEGLEEEIRQSDEYKERIYDALTRIDGLTHVSVAASTGSSPPPPTFALDHGAKVKLPKLSLPHFNGDVTKWTTFWDSFESAIHNNVELTDVDKFNYLRSLLDRSARDAISGLTLSSANYKEAIDVLKKRFGNKQSIISKRMELLLAVEAVSSDQNLKALRRLYDATESHIRSLKSLGVNSASYGALLSSVLLSKLPPDVRLILSRKFASADLDMDALLVAFEEELAARERASDSAHSQPRRHHDRSQPTPTSALLTSSMTCCFCQQQHPSVDCTSMTSVVERKQFLRANGRCFNCLRKGHVGRNCRSSGKCQCCRGRHHTSICEIRATSGASTTPRQPNPAKPAEPTTSTLDPDAPAYTPTVANNALCVDSKKTVLLQTARCVVYNPSNPTTALEVRLLFDTGSQKSYITEHARSLLSLQPSGEQQLSIATFGSCHEQMKVCPIVNVGIQLKDSPPVSLNLYVVPTICEPVVGQPISACIERNPKFKELPLADCSDGSMPLNVDILIGSDNYWDLVTGGICRGEGGLAAIHTKLGWVLSGPVSACDLTQCSTNLIATHVLRADTQPTETEGLDAQLRSFWELESLGIHEVETTLYDKFSTNVTFQDGRYRVSLPWKEFHEPLPDNYDLSHHRMKGLLHRLSQNSAVLKEYDRTIQDQLKNGIIEPVRLGEPCSNPVHYLPHHAVVRQDKTTTKLRIVYDASAKQKGPSLNECLHKGPSFNQLILDLLLRFRSYNVALTADVEKAFLMIAVAEHDRDVLRFLWVDDVFNKNPQLQAFRFARVVFGVSSSPFLLNATFKFHLERYLESHKEVVKRLLHSTYVDDIVTGADTEEDAFALYTQAKDMFRSGGFNLRKFLTNSSDLQRKIDRTEGIHQAKPDSPTLSYADDTYAKETLGTAHLTTNSCEHKVLGVAWDSSSDCLLFDMSTLAQLARDMQPTKRNLVSLIGKFYDPLGFLAPITIKYKMLFQTLCRSKLEWDHVLPNELLKEWRDLITDLTEGHPVSIPRKYLRDIQELPTSVTLCGFCDASTRAYAAVIYLLAKTNTKTVVQFVVAKTRVAPLQTQTIPRLELLSAFLLAKLIVSVSSSLESVFRQLEVKCYTDSKVALYWICGVNKEWKPFVQNRINVIRKNVHPDLWSHCPGASNPADLPSRGLSTLEFSVNQLWRNGPEWLTKDPATPQCDLEQDMMPDQCYPELRASAVKSLNLISTDSQGTIESLMKCQDYSTLSRLLRVTAQILRAIKGFKHDHTVNHDTITAEELAQAESLWIISAQQHSVGEKDFANQKQKFRLFEDDAGVWCCGGRLSNVDVPYSVKHPILLPRTHPLTGLIVRDAHDRVFHNGVKETLTEIRRKFWIPKGRSLVRQIIHRCIPCRKFEGAPFQGPPPPPLPTCRVKDDPAFTYTGVDFAGPLSIRTPNSCASTKVWICLFTCFVTRAVHLDAVSDQSTLTFLRCLKRFAARRGLPRQFVSDNGKTFKAAAKYIQAIFKDSTVKENLADLGTEWFFNIERAPWWGGAFERMVKSTKRCLRKMIGRAHFSLDELITALAEIEAVINSRPLSYISASDLEEPLTPSHLLVGRRILNLPDHLGHLTDPKDEEFSVDPSVLTRRMKHFNNTLNHFWNRWRTEYLNELREVHYHTSHKAAGIHPGLTVGEVVIVHDEQLPRGLWKLGMIQETVKGRDGEVRGAVVKMAKRHAQQEVLRRPIQLLYPLEVSQPMSATETETDTIDKDNPPEVTTLPEEEDKSKESEKLKRRSQRITAREADDRRKACMHQLEDI